ncbi:hypothetical protein NDU88_002166 [Pleurodeles waltl]|uniref:Uncharacterized protein n=1 Tax=Pleurodeles waltl TaxID=8319 RepID=A0AAV7WKG2_PLEWA|nr:hypothetical protein NDU88_002166 [Pleurodeles waltl]
MGFRTTVAEPDGEAGTRRLRGPLRRELGAIAFASHRIPPPAHVWGRRTGDESCRGPLGVPLYLVTDGVARPSRESTLGLQLDNEATTDEGGTVLKDLCEPETYQANTLGIVTPSLHTDRGPRTGAGCRRGARSTCADLATGGTRPPE